MQEVNDQEVVTRWSNNREAHRTSHHDPDTHFWPPPSTITAGGPTGRSTKAGDHQLPHLQARTGRPVLRAHLRSREGLGVQLRQVQAVSVTAASSATGAAWRSRRRRCGGNGSGTSSWPCPVCHIWYFKSPAQPYRQPARTFPCRNLERVIYYESYVMHGPEGNTEWTRSARSSTEEDLHGAARGSGP